MGRGKEKEQEQSGGKAPRPPGAHPTAGGLARAARGRFGKVWSPRPSGAAGGSTNADFDRTSPVSK
jgi:hypothetical protein